MPRRPRLRSAVNQERRDSVVGAGMLSHSLSVAITALWRCAVRAALMAASMIPSARAWRCPPVTCQRSAS